MIKFVLFDFANTLVYKPDVFKVFQNFILDNYNQEFSLEEVKKVHDEIRESIVFPDKTTEEFYLGFNDSVLKALGIESASKDDLRTLFRDLRELKWKAFPDSIVLEDFLLPKAVLSNWDECLEDYVKMLTPYNFEFAMGSFSTGVSKPDKKFYQTALDKIQEFHKVDAQNVLMIGDSPNLDIEPALNLGMKAVLIDREGQFKRESYRYGGIIIDSLYKLPELINKLNEPAI